MITISLCMIVKNEEETLEKCLKSVIGKKKETSIADEIIIVDTGSDDRTKEIAKKYTDKIYDFTWIDDFSTARNFSFEKANMDYILWLDADDIILPKDKKKFLNLKKNLSEDIDVVMMKYNTGFDEEGNTVFSFFRERLSKREKKFRWKEPVHEYLAYNGEVIFSDICITHSKPKERDNQSRNLKIYENILLKGESLSERGTYYYARELKDHGRFSEAIGFFETFLSFKTTWIEDKINACRELGICYLSQGNSEMAFLSLLKSFVFDTPRAEVCCQIGYILKENKEYKQAFFWFNLAQSLEIPKNNLGFIHYDYWGYIPCLECVVCLDMLGEQKAAEEFNEKAAIFKPNSKSVEHNRKYFENLKQKNA